eukprot:167025-Rhodomonas_salina.1
MRDVEGGEEERAVPKLSHPAARAVRAERERGRERVREEESGRMLEVEGGEEARAVPELNHPAARAVRTERERGRERVRDEESRGMREVEGGEEERAVPELNPCSQHCLPKRGREEERERKR